MSEENENYVTRAQEANEQRGVTNDEKKLRNINNNANMVRNAADMAANSNNAYAKAIGTGIKVADKLSGGKASENLGKKLNTLNKLTPGGRGLQKKLNKLSESGTADRISNAMNKKKGAAAASTSAYANSKSKANAVSEGKGNDDFSRREVEEQTSDGGGGSFKVTVKVLKIALIALAPILMVVIFMNLIVSASQTYLGVIGLDMADKVSGDEAEAAIKKKASEDLLNEEITDENVDEGLVGYIEDVFIDDTKKIYNKKMSSINFISEIKDNTKYTKSQLEELEDFYSDINSYKGQGYNMDTVYKFFFKLLYIQKHYKKYGIELDMPLLMSILMVQSEDKSEVFVSNVKDYKLYYGCTKENNPDASDKCEPQDNPIFKIDYDWSNYTLSANDSSHDIEILAQNMVKKTSDSGCDVNGEDGPCYDTVDDEEYREFLMGFLERKYFISKSGSDVEGSGSISYEESSSNGTATMEPGIELSSEPDPSTAINYWSNLDSKDFVYPKDKSTGLPLGAWPKNYQNVPAQLENVKVYQGAYIWPLTPTSGIYTIVYEHNGMDIMSTFGSPIYSPVDGELVYSTWGNTVNTGSDETAYSVTIRPDTKVTYGGTTIDMVYLTHMSGIIYRCDWWQCNRKVKKGELVGFVGTAAGNATSPGWAPHLHLTYYNSSDYGTGLQTSVIQKFYGIKPNTKIVAGG